jgi:ATP-dependent protease Clp ATPase subunit
MKDNVIPFKEPDPKCSFCGTTKSNAQKFVLGPNGKNICGVCIQHATKRLKEEQK